MDSIQLNIKQVFGFLSEEVILNQAAHASACNEALHDGSREGNDFLGWVNLPLPLQKKISGKSRMQPPSCGHAATQLWWWALAEATWEPVL